MKVLICVCLLAIVAWGLLVIQPQADGAYFQNNGTFEIVMDTGAATTTDSSTITTPVPAYRFKSVIAKIKFLTPYNALHGWANSDTVVCRLRTSLSDGQVKTLDSMKLSPPCSLMTRIPVAVATEDTLLWRDLYWTWVMSDSTSDTLFTVSQPWYWEVIVRE